MQHYGRKRLAAIIAPLLLLGVGLAVACTDAGAPTEVDGWAAQSLVSMRVRTELTSYGGGVPQLVGSNTSSMPMPVFRDGAQDGAAFSRAATGRNIEVRHFKDRQRRIHSIGFVRDGTGRPPTLAYAFENGRIRAILSSEYQRYGQGWIRLSSRVTYFDSTGGPQLQATIRPEGSAQADQTWGTLRLHKARADILAFAERMLLPKPLHAEESGCFAEWIAYSAASFVLASASAAVTAAIGTCATGGPLAPPACEIIEKALAAWLVALTAWNVTLDKLVTCREMQPPTDGSGSGGDSRGDGGGSGWDDGDRYSPDNETTTVMDFIRNAIERGNVSCSDARDYCVYY